MRAGGWLRYVASLGGQTFRRIYGSLSRDRGKIEGIPSADGATDPQSSNAQTVEFDADRPINEKSRDRLGFAQIAEKLSRAVVSSGVSDGLVVGIEGRWGSGKSSILNLLCTGLESESKVSVIRFEPWIVGDRDRMVEILLGYLAGAVALVEKRSQSKLKKTADDALLLSEKLRKYGASASRGLSPIAKLAGVFGVPFADLIGKSLDTGADILGQGSKAKSLAFQKNELISGLRDLDHKFVVIIDDLDRL